MTWARFTQNGHGVWLTSDGLKTVEPNTDGGAWVHHERSYVRVDQLPDEVAAAFGLDTQAEEPPSALTTREAATFAGVSERTITRWRRWGYVRARRRANGRVLIERDSLAAFVQGNKEAAE